MKTLESLTECYKQGYNDAIQECLSLIGNHIHGDHSGDNNIKSLFGCLKKADPKGSSFKTAINWYNNLNKALKKLRK